MPKQCAMSSASAQIYSGCKYSMLTCRRTVSDRRFMIPSAALAVNRNRLSVVAQFAKHMNHSTSCGLHDRLANYCDERLRYAFGS
jgi:hypothetical protein